MIDIAIVYYEQALRNLSGWCFVGGAQARHPVGFLRKGNAYRISGESSMHKSLWRRLNPFDWKGLLIG